MTNREYYLKSKRKILDRVLKWQKENKNKVNEKNKKWKHKNKDKVRLTHKRYKSKYQKQVFEHYGRRCASCGCDNKRLAIDHINNDGAEFRKKYKAQIWVWIITNNYPPDLQVLCYKCNENKKRAVKEGLTLKKWMKIKQDREKMVLKLRKRGLSYSQIIRQLKYGSVSWAAKICKKNEVK